MSIDLNFHKGLFIVTNLTDVIFYIDNDDLIETKDQVKDMKRILNNNLHLLPTNYKKVLINKMDRLYSKWNY